MSGVRKRVPARPQPERLALSSTSCDRCTDTATIVGAGDARAWGNVSVFVQGEGAYYADLCADCAAQLRGWIDAGRGPGMVDAVTRAGEPGLAPPEIALAAPESAP